MKNDKEPILGALYRHFKGGLYIPQNVAVHTETGEKFVIYNSVVQPYWIWARPLSMWNETVVTDGAEIPRFTLLEQSDRAAELLWDSLEDVPFYEDAKGEMFLETPWYVFDEDTPRDEIWEFFDKTHSKGVHYLLYERERTED